MMWTQTILRFKVIKLVAIQLCLRTVQVVCPVWRLPMASYSVLSSLMKWRQSVYVAEALNPQHHRLRRSNLPTSPFKALKSLITSSVWTLCVLSAVYSVRNWTVSDTVLLFKPPVMWTVILCWQSGIAFINDVWLLLPIRGAQISGTLSTWSQNFVLFA